jgi:hypothetical protein
MKYRYTVAFMTLLLCSLQAAKINNTFSGENSTVNLSRRQVYWHLPLRAEIERGSTRMSMRDIDLVIAEIARRDSNIRSIQLQVKHPGYDDDGIWYFWIPELPGEVIVESSDGMLPFFVETDKHDESYQVSTVSEAVDTILAWLRLPGGHPTSFWHPR